MAQTDVAILDFGSSKITVLVGERGFGNTLKVKAKGMSDYAGFMDGEFLEPNNLPVAIFEAINKAEKMLNKRIKTLYVGVPSEFGYNQCYPLEVLYNKPTKIKEKHISKLFASANEKFVSDTHSVINKVPIYFKLDDGNKIDNPVDAMSTSLYTYASFIFVDKLFINNITSALSQQGIRDFEFVASGLAESLYLIAPQVREKSSILIDCGYITTGITHVLQDAIIDLKSFSLGGGHITMDLSEVLKIPFSSAEQLKRKIVLTLDPQPHDYYEAVVNNKILKFSAKNVNDIALARIDMMGDAIKKSLMDFTNTIAPSVSVFLTGGGLCYIKGIKEYLSKYVGFNIDIVAPAPLQYNKPDLSSEISLLEVAIAMENN